MKSADFSKDSGRFVRFRAPKVAEQEIRVNNSTVLGGRIVAGAICKPENQRSHAPESGNFRAFLNARPGLRKILLTAFVVAEWGIIERLAKARDHCRLVRTLGAPFDIHPDHYVDLMTLPMIADGLRVTLDQPHWLLRDGLLALSLWDKEDRVFSLTFTLAEQRGRLAAYIGGIQGRNDPQALDHYRALTKAACGMRPRDLLIELFRLICREIDVRAIYAVSNRGRIDNSFYYRRVKRDSGAVALDYDAVWTERAGAPCSRSLFALSVSAQMRNLSDVPAKKRSMYRARQAMLTEIALLVATRFAFRDQMRIETHRASAA